MYVEQDKNMAKASGQKDAISSCALAREIIETFGSECTCTASDCCDLCDFVQRLAISRGVVDFAHVPLVTQSQVEMAPETSENAEVEQNVEFTGDNDPVLNLRAPLIDQADSSVSAALGNFLSRPVQIHTESWTIGNTLNYTTDNFRPWNLYFNKTSIKKKLDNYYMLRCNLHLKFVMNASPFHYGCCLVAYQPMTNFNPGFTPSGAAGEEKTALSQRPHIYLYPQDSQGGEIVLPFVYYKAWLDATSATDLTNMGQIVFQSFGALQNANGATGSIDIQVYAWAENVELAGPTVALAVQSRAVKKDEYEDKGVVSKPASAIARAAKMLGTVPVIGPFATATSYAAEAVSSIASLFGYTNTPVIDDIHQTQLTPFPNLASTDIGMPIDKLTLDAKNELSIDPKLVGSQMRMNYLFQSFALVSRGFGLLLGMLPILLPMVCSIVECLLYY